MRHLHSSGRHARLALALASLWLAPALVPAPAAAQQSAPRWVVNRDAFADLWYHGLAVVGGARYGPLPLYAPEYVVQVREAKRRFALATGVPLATPLDAAAPRLRRAFASDSAFDVLHFVPLYFMGESPVEVLAAFRSALGGVSVASNSPSSLRARVAMIVASFPEARQRRTLRAFVTALDDEWRLFVRTDRETRPPDEHALLALQRAWDGTIAPPLRDWLASGGRPGGLIVVAPAVGAEGRVARIDKRTIVVVGAALPGGVPVAPLLSAVRELAFPLLDVAPAATALGRPGDLEAQREIAAVRAGAMVLEARAPALVADYRQLFTTAAGGVSGRAFERRFPLDSASEAALRAVVAHDVAAPRPR